MDAMVSHGMIKEFENLMLLGKLIPRTHFRAFPGSRRTGLRTAKL